MRMRMRKRRRRRIRRRIAVFRLSKRCSSFTSFAFLCFYITYSAFLSCLCDVTEGSDGHCQGAEPALVNVAACMVKASAPHLNPPLPPKKKKKNHKICASTVVNVRSCAIRRPDSVRCSNTFSALPQRAAFYQARVKRRIKQSSASTATPQTSCGAILTIFALTVVVHDRPSARLVSTHVCTRSHPHPPPLPPAYAPRSPGDLTHLGGPADRWRRFGPPSLRHECI